jgi:hypothetical protein
MGVKDGKSPTTPALSIQNTNRPSSQDAFPASVAFDAINDALNISEADRKDALKQGQSIFGFKLKNAAGKEEAWHIDLKETGTVGKGEAPAGKKADRRDSTLRWMF